MIELNYKAVVGKGDGIHVFDGVCCVLECASGCMFRMLKCVFWIDGI